RGCLRGRALDARGLDRRVRAPALRAAAARSVLRGELRRAPTHERAGLLAGDLRRRGRALAAAARAPARGRLRARGAPDPRAGPRLLPRRLRPPAPRE